MYSTIKHVGILGENRKLPVVLGWLHVGTLRLTHRRKNRSHGYTPFYSQLNPEVIPLLFSKFNSVNFQLYPLSTGPIITTTYINTKKC